MKKIYYILALAMVGAMSFTSCSKDEPEVEPEKVYPVDSLVAGLAYDYSEAAIQILDIKYEVTDFNGNTETITVTKPGYTEKMYKTENVNAKITVKLFATYKNNIDEIKAESADLTFQSGIFGYFGANGNTVSVFPENGYVVYSKGVQTKAEIEDYAKYITEASPITYSVSLPNECKNGVTESWLKEHDFLIMK